MLSCRDAVRIRARRLFAVTAASVPRAAKRCSLLSVTVLVTAQPSNLGYILEYKVNTE